METNMHTIANVHRFGPPAFIAATLHVVVFFAFNHPDLHLPTVKIKDPPTKIIPIPLDPIVIPPAETTGDATEPVHKLAQGPSLPDSQDLSKHEGPITITTEITKKQGPVDLNLDKIPTNWSPESTGPGNEISGGPQIFSPDMLDKLPRAKVQVAPIYPRAKSQSGTEGTVLVEFNVDAGGNVTAAHVVKSSDHDFDEAAVRAVLKWKFEPGRYRGKAVPFRMAVPIGFTLNTTD